MRYIDTYHTSVNAVMRNSASTQMTDLLNLAFDQSLSFDCQHLSRAQTLDLAMT